MRCLSIATRPLRDALALAPALLERAREEGAVWIAASVIEGPAILLGAAQRAGRVVDLAACAGAGVAVYRRATTGPAVHLGGRGALWTLALPHAAALAADATPRTLLNRNVRGFLKGLSRAGVPAHYFGREWISARHRPSAALCVETAPDGVAVIEVWAGHDAPTAIPARLAAPEERAVDRWLGKEPAALAELLPQGSSLEDATRAVLEAVIERAQRAPSPPAQADPPPLAPERFTPITDPLDPLPGGHGAPILERVPIGWIEAAGAGAEPTPAEEPRVWLGGDVITGTWVLEVLGREAGADALDPGSIVLEGAKLEELSAIARRARASVGTRVR